ncbi:MAG TPA: dihydroorotase, partial [Candidatus Angelobacter sp.]|nr:dihydroorotase [Candidatus Angelobacter sp.]
MAESYDLIIRGGIAATPNGIAAADIAIRAGRIAAIGAVKGSAAEEIDAGGLHVLPGVIDTQVHFREPGLEHKEDLATGTAAAALGGVTAVFEMPNTKPSTLTAEDLADKRRRALGRVWCDIAFFVGAAAENADQLGELERLPGCAGVKMFMGSSTGNLLVADEENIRRVLENGRRRMAVHSEDEVRLRERHALVKDGADVAMHPVWRDIETAVQSTERLLRLARAAGRRVHVLHVTTAEEIPILAANKDIATVETTPQHLTLVAPECYQRLGTFAQMNPPIREARHREALWRAIDQGVVDCIGSDHAPHTREEKAK